MQVLSLCLVIYPRTIGFTSWLAYPLVCVRSQKCPRPPKLPLPGPVSQELCFTSELCSFKDSIPLDLHHPRHGLLGLWSEINMH